MGLFLSQHALQSGAHVYAVTRTITNELQDLAASYDRLTVIEIEDYTYDSIANISTYMTQNPVDMIINNASMYENDQPFPEMKGDQYQAFFNVHMMFPAALCEAYFNSCKNSEHNGNIINMTDIFAERPSPKSALYCSTKAGLESLTKSMAVKYAPILRVNSIQPGPVKFLPEHDADYRQNVLSQTLIPKEAGFTPILQAVEFILDNDFVTGTSIKVDGGRSLAR